VVGQSEGRHPGRRGGLGQFGRQGEVLPAKNRQSGCEVDVHLRLFYFIFRMASRESEIFERRLSRRRRYNGSMRQRPPCLAAPLYHHACHGSPADGNRSRPRVVEQSPLPPTIEAELRQRFASAPRTIRRASKATPDSRRSCPRHRARRRYGPGPRTGRARSPQLLECFAASLEEWAAQGKPPLPKDLNPPFARPGRIRSAGPPPRPIGMDRTSSATLPTAASFYMPPEAADVPGADRPACQL